MKYKFKMYSYLLITLAIFALTSLCSLFIKSTIPSLLLLVLLVIELLVITQRPKKLFQKQLNENFMIVRFPGSKWGGIFQRPSSLETISECRLSYRRVCKSMQSIFQCIQNEHGYFRTITHETIMHRLEKEAKAGTIVILTCNLAYKNDLSKIFHQAMRERCRRCDQSKTCPQLLIAKKIRQFYYIEFYIPNCEQPEALPLV